MIASGRSAGRRREQAARDVSVLNCGQLDLHSRTRSRGLQAHKIRATRGVGAVHDGDAPERRADLLQEAQPAAGQLRRRIGDARDVRAGFVARRVRADHDDRDRARRLLGRPDRGVSDSEHEIDLELRELGREFLEPSGLSVGRSVLERDVARIPDEGLFDELLIGSRGAARVQPAHPICSPVRLHLDGRCRTGTRGRDRDRFGRSRRSRWQRLRRLRRHLRGRRLWRGRGDRRRGRGHRDRRRRPDHGSTRADAGAALTGEPVLRGVPAAACSARGAVARADDRDPSSVHAPKTASKAAANATPPLIMAGRFQSRIAGAFVSPQRPLSISGTQGLSSGSFSSACMTMRSVEGGTARRRPTGGGGAVSCLAMTPSRFARAERRRSREHFVDDRSERIDVCLLGDRLSTDLLGREILRRARVEHALRRGSLQQADQLDVHQLHVAVREDHHVAGTEAAVDEPHVVDRLDGGAEVERPASRGGEVERLALGHDVAQAPALDELHDGEGLAGLGFPEFQNADQSRVGRRPGRDRPARPWTALTTFGFAASSRGRNRIATRWAVVSSSARQTVPKAPDPSSRTMR